MTVVANEVVDDRQAACRPAVGAGLRQRVRAEFLEMPGLKLTLPQAARIFGVDVSQSAALLQDLIDEGFLARDARGSFLRRSLVVTRSVPAGAIT